MRDALTAAVLAGLLALCPSPCAGQSVAEAARREKERRAKQPPATPGKVYTDADLASRSPGKATPADAGPAKTAAKAAETAAARDAAGDDEARERRLLAAQWRERFADARRLIAEADARCWHRVVRTVFEYGIPVQQWVNEYEESEELRQRKRDIADLEEEYRKTGLPPGWVRE